MHWNPRCCRLLFVALTVVAGCSGGGGGGNAQVDPVVCTAPLVPNSSGTLCVCPAGTHTANQTCVPDSTTDTTPPTVALVSPTNGSTLSGTVNVVATVVDASSIAEVALYLDNSNRAETFVESPAGTCTAQLNTATLSNGSHSVKVCAIDSHANNGCSSTVSVSVSNSAPDTTPPAVSISAPLSGATVSGNLAVTASVTDDRGVATVALLVDGAQTGNPFTENPAHVFTASVNTIPLTNGSHTIKVCAFDTSSNSACSSDTTITVNNSQANTWRSARSTSISMSGVWGFNSSDVWFGSVQGTGDHWDGTSWTTIPFGGPIWGSAPNDFWSGTTIGTIIHWNGSATSNYALSGKITSIWGSGPNDVWAVSESWSSGSSLYHWNGSGWTQSSNYPTYSLHDVWGSGPNDVWAVGKDTGTAGGVVLHWNGSSWTVKINPSEEISQVSGSGPNDVWVVSLYEGYTLHWNGTSWSFSYAPDRSINLYGLWDSGPNDVWAVGAYYSSGGIVLHWDGTSWTAIQTGTVGKINNVWGSGPNDVWFVGDGGIYHYGP